jgi:hypothetical protein
VTSQRIPVTRLLSSVPVRYSTRNNEAKKENPSAPNVDEIEFIQTVVRPPPSAKKKSGNRQTVSEREVARIRKADSVHLDKNLKPKKVEFDDKALVAALDGLRYAAQFIKEQLDKFHNCSDPIASMKTKEKRSRRLKSSKHLCWRM